MNFTTLCYIEKENQYLMLHRVSKKKDGNKDKWIGVGGHFEEGESPEDCLLREVREETGLELVNYQFRGIVTFISDKWEDEYMCLYTADKYIDTKGRLIIPAKFRETLGEEFVISKGMDGCLFVYANDDWNAFEQKLTSLPLINKEARQFARFFLAGAATVEVDKQGRILLPAHLREFAGLEKDVVLVGVGSRVEIWSKDKWEAMNLDADMDEITGAMEGLGLTI